MGNNLIERIKKFYYLSTVKKIAFVDGYALAYWLKKNPDVETFFFNTPVNYTPPTAPNVQLQCIRILYESDSYTIDSVLEDEVVYPLYLSNNYILEGEFTAYGVEIINCVLHRWEEYFRISHRFIFPFRTESNQRIIKCIIYMAHMVQEKVGYLII